MLLNFVVAGDFLRPFVHLLQAAAKQGTVLFFQPLDDVLVVRTVGPNSTLYLLASIGTEHFHEYRYERKSTTVDSFAIGGVVDAEDSPSRDVDIEELQVPVLSKALLATVLRQTQGLQFLSARHDSRGGDGGSSDMMQWECVSADGITKVFQLRLLHEKLERAYVNPEKYVFDACASSKTMGHFIRHLPASQFVVLQPQETHMELLVMNCSEVTGRDVGSKVLVRQGDLFFMRRIQRANEENVCHYSPLPGKYVEFKPLKQICLLADQLGLMIRMRSGMGSVPLFMETVTMQEAYSLKVGDTQALSLTAAAEPTAANLCHIGIAPMGSSLRIRYAVYIPAIDIYPASADRCEASCDASRRSVASTATTNRDSRLLMDVASPRVSAGRPSGDMYAARNRWSIPNTTAIDVVGHNERSGVAPQGGALAPALPSGGFLACSGSVSANGRCTAEVLAKATPVASGQFPSREVSPAPPPGVFLDGNLMVVQSTFQEGEAINYERNTHKRPRNGEKVGGGAVSPFDPTDMSPCFIPSAPSGSCHAEGSGGCIQSAVDLRDPCQHDAPEQSRSPQAGGRQLSLDARYPLDFTAYVQELDEGLHSDDIDEDDEELQRFLDSCASVLIVPPTQG